MNIGAEAFYLYDNTGSTAKDSDAYNIDNNMARNGKTRWQFNIAEMTKHLTDADIQVKLNDLATKYPIQYIRWANKDSKGNIIYDQYNSCVHCAENADADWIAFIDIDEFIITDRDSKTPRKITELINSWDEQGIKRVFIQQFKMKDRYLHFIETGEASVKNITEAMKMDTKGWAQKIILSRKHFLKEVKVRNYWIHLLNIKEGKSYEPDVMEIGFNHYNLNEFTLKFMESAPDIIRRKKEMGVDRVLADRL